MIQVIFSSQPAFLLDDFPDWAGLKPQLEVTIPNAAPRGLTGREERRAYGDSLRFSLKYSSMVRGADVISLRNSLQALNTQPVLCPLWMAGFGPGDDPIVESEFYALMGDGAAPAIAAAADMPFDRPAYPLMVGRLTSWPDPSTLTDVAELVQFEFSENSASILTLPAFEAPAGLDAAGGARPLFPFRADWTNPPRHGGAEVEIERRNIGASRSTADAYYAQRSRRHGQQSFTLANEKGWQLLSFWLQQLGSQNNFWLPSALSEAQLVDDVDAADTTLQANAAGPATPFFVCLDDLVNRTPVKVTASALNVWTLSAATGVDYTAARTRLESLVLSRFDGNTLSLSWQSPVVATCEAKFVEVPWEVDAVEGETIGETMGALPVTAYLYVFTINYPGGAATYRFTNFERDLTNGGHTFTQADMQNDDITDTATIERQQLTITSRNFAGNPLAQVPFVIEWPVLLDIFECDVAGSAAINLRALFSGEVSKVETDGPYLTATATSLSHIFDRQVPRFLFQTICNLNLFEARCGLNPGDWNWQGLVTAVTANLSLTLNTVHRVSGAVIALPNHFFAGGYAVIGVGAAQQIRMIADSTPEVGGSLIISLGSPLTSAPGVGATVNFFPGCDGRKETCNDIFNNYNTGAAQRGFVGFPFIPVANPTAVQMGTPSGGGKKS